MIKSWYASTYQVSISMAMYGGYLKFLKNLSRSRKVVNETFSGVIWQFDISFLKSKDDNVKQVSAEYFFAATGRSSKCHWPKLAPCLSQFVLQSVNDASWLKKNKRKFKSKSEWRKWTTQNLIWQKSIRIQSQIETVQSDLINWFG